MTAMGKANTEKRMFSRTTTIQQRIATTPEALWAILVDGERYPEWNSTITHFEGRIEKGETIRLKSYLDDKRTFKLKVKEMVVGQKLVWGDAMGQRTFTLITDNMGTLFTMTERIGGPLFPLFSRMIPPFDESFERFVHDLEQKVTQP